MQHNRDKHLKPILQIKGINKGFNGVEVLSDINLDIVPGEFVGLFGLNGSGKSTLLNVISTNVLPDSGTILINGYDVLEDHANASLNLGMMQQQPDMDSRMNCLNILTIHAGLYGIPYAQAKLRALELMNIVGLEDAILLTPMKMSGGMINRLMLAKAMMNKPTLLILDEPTAGVDFKASEAIYQYIKKLNEEEGVTIILTTHTIDNLANLCHKLVFLKQRQIIVRSSGKQESGYMVCLDNISDLNTFKTYSEGNKRVQFIKDEIFCQMKFKHLMDYLRKGDFQIKAIRYISGVEAQIIQNI
jgi:ABC-2 type transport system ATP-binding protein